MNRLKGGVTVFLFFAIFSCYSQIAMELSIQKKYFLEFENIFITLKVRNLSSHPLIFGKNEKLFGKLTFYVRDENGRKVGLRKGEDEDFLFGHILSPGKTTEVTMSLSQVYAINKPGKYTAKAIISHNQLTNNYSSNTETFFVKSGVVIWKGSVGVPAVSSLDKSKTISKRLYEVKTYFDGSDKVYCLVVSDKDYIYGVARIGFEIGVKPPECMVDNYSRLHILLENRYNEYDYYVYDVNCNLDEKESYNAKNSIPHLSIDDKSGEVGVVGGELIVDKE